VLVSFTLFAQFPCIIPTSINSDWSHLLGAFAKFRKATVSLVMSVRSSVCIEQLGSNWTDLREILCFVIFRNTVEKILVSLILEKNKGHFT